MEVQLLTVAAPESGAGSPGRPKQLQGSEDSVFAALLAMLQGGQAMTGPLPEASAFGPAPSAPTLTAALPGMAVPLPDGGDWHVLAQMAAEQAASDPAAVLPDGIAGTSVLPETGGDGQPVATGSMAPTAAQAMPVAPGAAAAPSETVVADATAAQLAPHGEKAPAEFSAPPALAPPAHPAPGNGQRTALPDFGDFASASADSEAEFRAAAHAADRAEPAVTVQLPSSAPLTVAHAAEPTAATATAKPDVPAAAWAQVVHQLEQRAQSELRPGGPTLDLQLHPAELGSVRVRLTLQDGQLAAQLQVVSAAAKEALDAGLAELRATLQAQGFDVQSLSVDVRDSGQQANFGQHAWTGGQSGRRGQTAGQPAAAQAWAAAAAPATASGLLDIRA